MDAEMDVNLVTLKKSLNDLVESWKKREQAELDLKQPVRLQGAWLVPSDIWRNRWECYFWGKQGRMIRYWIRDTFGDTDDFVWARGNNQNNQEYSALITAEQLTLTLLRWQ